MRVLVSNDDGVDAPGIRALAKGLREAGHEVLVVAPDRDRSGASNSLTLDRPLSVKQAASGYYYVNGTPTDCVHVAVTGFLDFKPDMVFSGINHGPNMGEDVLYSGTVAAAMEVPAILSAASPVTRPISATRPSSAPALAVEKATKMSPEPLPA